MPTSWSNTTPPSALRKGAMAPLCRLSLSLSGTWRFWVTLRVLVGAVAWAAWRCEVGIAPRGELGQLVELMNQLYGWAV